jgi:hypothetical protein
VLLNANFFFLFHWCNICHNHMGCYTHTASSAGHL